MSVDELRHGLARAAATVVPDEDPYGRLMVRHARRRRRGRLAGLGAALAGLLAAALLGPTVVGAGGGGPTDPDAGQGYPVTSDWIRRLLDSPARGNLADDRRLIDELATVFDRDREHVGMSADLPEVRVLFADDSAGFRLVVVAYRSATSAALVTGEGPVGASPRQLVRQGGFSNMRAEPFTVFSAGSSNGRAGVLLGLAPAGCAMSYARSGYFSGRSVQRRWEPAPAGDHMLVENSMARGWWRVECDGRIRHAGPISGRLDQLPKTSVDAARPNDVRPAGSPPADPATAQEAATSYRLLADASGLTGPRAPAIRWAGRVDGTDAVLAGHGRGPVLLQVGAGPAGLLALAPPEDATPDDTETLATSRAARPLVATAVVAEMNTAAVRVPARSGGHAVLTDRLLVVGPREAVRVEAVAAGTVRAAADVRDGAALLTLPVGTGVTLRTLDRDGQLLESVPLREPPRGERLFTEPLISDW